MNARALLVVAAMAAALPGPAAHAAPVVLSVAGDGGYFPGMGPVPMPQVMYFHGTATETGLAAGATYTCDWQFNGIAETLAQGVGTWYGTCGPHTFSGCTYTRAGTDLTVSCPSGWAGKLVWVADVASASHYTMSGYVATP